MTTEQFKISAKNLGYINMPDFCPRCFWLRLRTLNHLPWQSFPGIFSSIDAYTKHCVHAAIDSNNENPPWMLDMGGPDKLEITGYEKVPHWSKSLYHDDKSNITLSGGADDWLVRSDGTKVVPDWKTAKYTANQDKLFPIYEVQLNVYSILKGKHEGEFPDLYLVYMEPQTNKKDADSDTTMPGFLMRFNAKVVPVETSRKLIRNMLTIARDIYEMKQPPKGVVGPTVCDECWKLEVVMKHLSMVEAVK